MYSSNIAGYARKYFIGSLNGDTGNIFKFICVPSPQLTVTLSNNVLGCNPNAYTGVMTRAFTKLVLNSRGAQVTMVWDASQSTWVALSVANASFA